MISYYISYQHIIFNHIEAWDELATHPMCTLPVTMTTIKRQDKMREIFSTLSQPIRSRHMVKHRPEVVFVFLSSETMCA